MSANEAKILSALFIAACLLLVILIFFIITIKRYHRKNMLLYKEKVATEIETLEKERKRVATDLHDHMGPMLSAVKLQAGILRPQNAEDALLVSKINQTLDNILSSIRIISNDLVPGVLERKGLLNALNDVAEQLNKTGTMCISVLYEGGAGRLSQKSQLHLYRIITEIFNNAVKHAKAGEASLMIAEEDSSLRVEISDNGCGFDVYEQLAQHRGNGLQNIQNRVELLKGKMDLVTSAGKGTFYSIKIPLENHAKNKSGDSR